MANKPVIALDLDNVVFDTLSITDEFVKIKLGLNPKPYTTYDFKHYPDAVAQAIIDFYSTPESCKAGVCHPAFPMFYDYLTMKGYFVKFVSARRPELLNATLDQFKRAGIQGVTEENVSLVHSHDKNGRLREINPVVFVDDSPTVVLGAAADKSLANTKIGLVSNARTVYNQYLQGHPTIIHGDNVVEVVARAMLNKRNLKVR